jgi:hypothetical protein
MKKIAAITAVCVSLGVCTIATGGTAEATTSCGGWPYLELEYNSNDAGASWGTNANVYDLAGHNFCNQKYSNGSTVPGSGQPVKNNAAGAFNYSGKSATVWYHSGYWGSSVTIDPAEGAGGSCAGTSGFACYNFPSFMKNQDASISF